LTVKKELVEHEQIGKALKGHIYFALIFVPWEREINEKTNGFIRQNSPEGNALLNLTTEQAHRLTDQLNNRPRKTRGGNRLRGSKSIYL